MKPLPFSWKKFQQLPVVGILRQVAPEDVSSILPRYCDAGFTTVEITIDSPQASRSIAQALRDFGDVLNVGAGTVCTLKDLDEALTAGAQFIVTPILNEDVIRSAVAQNIPVFPGCYTPTEIFRAASLGAPVIKVFPAASLGINYIKEIKAPLKNIRLLPTGGITLDNCTDFLDAGVAGLGIGSQLFHTAFIQAGAWDELAAHFKKFAEKISTRLHAHNIQTA